MLAAISQAAKATGYGARRLHHPVLRQIAGLGIGIFCVWSLVGYLTQVDLDLVFRSFQNIAPWRWGVAGVATAGSFAAIAWYDVYIGRELGLRVQTRDLASSGLVATAFAQLVGFGLFTGALARWRMLGSVIDPIRATMLTGAVTLAFFLSALVPFGLACFAAGIFAEGFDFALVFGTGTLWLGLCLLSIWRPISLRHLPRAHVVLRMPLHAGLDLILAGTALFVLLPGLEAEFARVVAVFMLALFAGMISGTPGGVGAFEMTFLGLMPGLPGSEMLGGLLAFRIVYFLLPGLLAASFLIRCETWAQDRSPDGTKMATHPHEGKETPSQIAELAHNSDRVEAALVGQGEVDLLHLSGRGAAMMVRQGANSLIGLADPFGAQQNLRPLLAEFHAQACRQNLCPVVYKCDRSTARAAVRSGFSVHRFGLEAVLDPQVFSTSGPKMRQLRRKLSHAKRADLKVSAPPTEALPLSDMVRLARDSAVAHGGERGFSMARFNPEKLGRYRFYLAWRGDVLVGFLGVRQGKNSHGIDLMRHAPDAPDGTMHLLMTTAIAAAGRAGVPRFSLSSVPFAGIERPQSLTELAHWAVFHLPSGRTARGLYRFKSIFHPGWEPLFLALPRGATGILAGIDLYRLIRPRPLQNEASQLEADQFHIRASLP